MATTERWKDTVSNMKKLEWDRVVVWGKLELCKEYSLKNAVYGRPLTNTFWDDKDGQKRYTTEVSQHSAI
ncbi:MAG: single-stranded DNA-binding protein [Deltaproteobacteria bacterium]|nr:single-stranded DNA-binding protein [Deltaproteobacteria bacterium]